MFTARALSLSLSPYSPKFPYSMARIRHSPSGRNDIPMVVADEDGKVSKRCSFFIIKTFNLVSILLLCSNSLITLDLISVPPCSWLPISP